MRSLHHYIVNSEETLLTAVAKDEEIFKEQVEGKEEYKKRIDAEKEELESMKLHGRAIRERYKGSENRRIVELVK